MQLGVECSLQGVKRTVWRGRRVGVATQDLSSLSLA